MIKAIIFFIVCAVVFSMLAQIVSFFDILAKISIVVAALIFLYFLFKKLFGKGGESS